LSPASTSATVTSRCDQERTRASSASEADTCFTKHDWLKPSVQSVSPGPEGGRRLPVPRRLMNIAETSESASPFVPASATLSQVEALLVPRAGGQATTRSVLAPGSTVHRHDDVQFESQGIEFLAGLVCVCDSGGAEFQLRLQQCDSTERDGGISPVLNS